MRREHPSGGVRHVGVDDPLDAPRRVDRVDPEGLGHVAVDRGAGPVDVEAHPPAGEPGERQVAENGVGVGHRRPVAAPAVADRAGRGAGTLGPDEQGALTDPGDRTAPGADALHVDHRQPEVVAVPPVPVGLDLGLAVAHQTHVEARPTHVDGHEVVDPDLAGGEGGAHHPAGRTGGEQRHGPLRDVLGRHDAARRLHDQHGPAVARGTQLGLQAVHVAGDTRRHVGVHERGRHPLELGSPCHHLVRQGDVLHVGELLAQDLGGAPLMVGVHEREQEHDRHRPDPEVPQPAHAASDRVLVEGQDDLAPVVHPLWDRDPGPASGDRRGRRVRRVPDLLLVDAAHLDLVPVALSDEQPRRGAVHLDHRVVGGGGAVDEDLELAAEGSERHAEPLGQLRQAVHHPARLVLDGGRGLVEHHLTLRRDAEQVGERAADVDAEPVSHRPCGTPEAQARSDARRRAVASTSTASVRCSSEPVNTTP